MFKNPPECDRSQECRFVSLGGTSTLLAWQETYDRSGNRISGTDPNKTTWSWRCSICGKQWSEVT
jgi:hypothetical protein